MLLLGSDTIRKTSRARLYRPPRWMVDWRLDATALAGRHAAYEMELYYDGQSPRWSRVYVRDLETGRL